LQELESTFYANGGEFREFRLCEIFDYIKVKKHNYAKSNLPSQPSQTHNLPAITCTSVNQGIACYMPKNEVSKESILKNVISVAANGDAPAFYQPNEFTILQDAYALKFKGKTLNSNAYLYLTALLQKLLIKYNWNNKSGWNKIKNETIKLPTDSSGQIDFDFMESFIAELEAERVRELEAERVRELEAYLIATGLKDYVLSDSESAALKAFENLANNRERDESEP